MVLMSSLGITHRERIGVELDIREDFDAVIMICSLKSVFTIYRILFFFEIRVNNRIICG